MDKLLKINNLLKFVTRNLSYIGALSIVVMTVIIAIDVVLRYFFNSPMIGAHEVIEYLVLMIFVFCISDCWDSGMHVAMTIVYNKVMRMRSFFNVVIGLTGFTIFSILGWKLAAETIYAFNFDQISTELMLPIWPAKAVTFLCIFFFSLKLLIFTFLSVIRLKTQIIQTTR